MQKLVFSVLMIATTLTIFAPVRNFDFVWTDRPDIVQNKTIHPPSRAGVLASFTNTSEEVYIPLSIAGWAVQSKFAQTPEGRLDPQTFHLVNLGLHTLNSVLVLLILCTLFKSGFAAFLGALIFAIHPIQVEPVAWVSAFKTLLGTFFGLVALWQYQHYARKRDGQNRRSARPMPHFYVATLAFLAAMLSFPAMVVLPLAAFVLERLLPKKDSLSAPRKPLWPTVVWSLLAIPFAVLAISLQNTHGLTSEVPFWSRPLVAADAIAFYVNKLFVPLGIGPDYGRSPTFLLGHWVGYLSWLAPAVVAAVLLFWREKARTWLAAGAALLVIGLLPFLGLVAFEAQSMSTVANRYAYLGLLGPAVALAYVVSIPRKPAFALAAFAALVTYGWVTSMQLQHWKDDQALWSHALNINPASPIAHMILADRLRTQGKTVEAKEHYRKVLEINSVSPDPHFHLAEIERADGNNKRAVELYQKTLKLDPNYNAVHRSLGQALLAEQRPEEALEQFSKANKYHPNDPLVALQQGKAMLALDKKDEAVSFLRSALKSQDSAIVASAEALLGLTLQKLGKDEEAARHLTRALTFDGDNIEAHKILGDIRFQEKAYKEALPHYEKAVKSITDDPVLYHSLGRILLGEKRFETAAEMFTKALELRPKSGKIQQDLAIANFKLRQFGLSAEQFRLALKLDKNLPECHYYIGEMARWSGKKEQAIGRYYLALRIDKNHAKSHYRLGQHFLKKENPRRAISHFNSALKAAPEDRRYLGSLRRAKRALEEMNM